MPSSSLETQAAWSNYHLTLPLNHEPGQPPSMKIKNLWRLHAGDVGNMDAQEAMRSSAITLMRLMKDIDNLRCGRTEPFASGMVGRGWSFSELIGTEEAQVITEGLSWVKELPDSMRTPEAVGKRLVVCGGGTRLRELVAWAERRKNPVDGGSEPWSIPTSGTHLGPTIAGGFATASHGSRLGAGGLQNLVRAMHIVTSHNDHIIIQRARRGTQSHPDGYRAVPAAEHYPVFKESAVGDLKAVFKARADAHPPICMPIGTQDLEVECRYLESDEDFEHALIHLGCMGMVSSVVVEMVEKETFSVMPWKKHLTDDMLAMIDHGQWHDLAREFNAGADAPEFYELTIDPFDHRGKEAAHLFYFKRSQNKSRTAVNLGEERPVAANALGVVIDALDKAELNKDAFQELKDNGIELVEFPGADPLDPGINSALRTLIKIDTSLYDAYLTVGGFRAPDPGGNDFGLPHTQGSWGQIHVDEITGDVPGSLYNASFAIDRANSSKAIKAITDAVAHLHDSFVFTLRFISNPAGTLAFTRHPETAIIEIDGLSPYICARTIIDLQKADEADGQNRLTGELRLALKLLSNTLPRGALAVRGALKAANIDYSMHWAKLGELDREKVVGDFGPQSGGLDQIAQWRATREKILAPDGNPSPAMDFFKNPAAIKYGLVPA